MTAGHGDAERGWGSALCKLLPGPRRHRTKALRPCLQQQGFAASTGRSRAAGGSLPAFQKPPGSEGMGGGSEESLTRRLVGSQGKEAALTPGQIPPGVSLSLGLHPGRKPEAQPALNGWWCNGGGPCSQEPLSESSPPTGHRLSLVTVQEGCCTDTGPAGSVVEVAGGFSSPN